MNPLTSGASHAIIRIDSLRQIQSEIEVTFLETVC